MPSCLGIYIQKNLIKYAKISKERNNTKVEAYGVKSLEDDIDKIIDQIIKETYSFQRTAISVNIDKEKYAYANVFNLLKEQDQEKAINTEFDYFCNSNKKNRNTLEYRKIKAPSLDDKDKLRVIYAYTDKANLVERIQLLDGYRLCNISPIAPIIQNLNNANMQGNSAIINLEENTEITTLVNGQVYQVDQIDSGMKDVISLISERENSVQKAYEVCKNTTVYTRSGQNLKIEGNEYLDEIITILLDIIEKVKTKIEQNQIPIDNIYITGMGLVINNIDLLFQENFLDKKCEMLVPSFIEKTNVKINIKDYIEVNSAISIALQGLEENKKRNMNFTEEKTISQWAGKISEILGKDISLKGKKGGQPSKKQNLSFKDMLKGEWDLTEKMLLRGAYTLLIVIIMYVVASEFLTAQIKNKKEEADMIIANNKKEIDKVVEYDNLIKARTSDYQSVIDEIDEKNNEIANNYSSRNAIPNLLNKIMYNIPQGVQLLSVSNASGKNIIITAQAKQYDQLGYFKAVLEQEEILTNITTTKGIKQDGIINITITGELPY